MRNLALSVSMGLLAACGGGGGGGSSWLSFDRNPVVIDMYEGEAPRIHLTGTADGEPDSPISIGVFADGSLFDANTVGYSDEGDGYSRTFYGRLLSSLSVGTHEGFLEVRTCKDADPTVCAEPYGGSPWRIPVNVHVAASPGNPTSPANGDFSQGMTGWQTYVWSGGVASFAVNGGELKVGISSGGSSIFAIEMDYKAGIDLVAGHRYRLAFDARADQPRSIEAYVHEGADRDHDNTGEIYIQPPPSFSLGTTKQTFHADFTMPVTNRAAGIYFILGGSAADVYLSNVTVTDLTL